MVGFPGADYPASMPGYVGVFSTICEARIHVLEICNTSINSKEESGETFFPF
jgi:hypothetical protein